MKSSRNRIDQKEETRRLLLVAARTVWARQGILATPVSEVAREADRAHGSVFVHFGSQEGLISAVVEDFGLALARELHDLTEEGAGPRAVLEAHVRGLGVHEDFYRRLVIEGPLLPPEARLSLVGIQSALSFHLTPALEAGAVAGTLKALPPAFLFNAWVGLVHHYLVNRDLFVPHGPVLLARGAELVNQFLTLIGSEKGETL